MALGYVWLEGRLDDGSLYAQRVQRGAIVRVEEVPGGGAVVYIDREEPMRIHMGYAEVQKLIRGED